MKGRGRITGAENHLELSERASEFMVRLMQEKPDPVFCLAAGYSPCLSYRLFVKKVFERRLDTSRLRVVKLDEWYGIKNDDPAACGFFLQKEFLGPLKIDKERYTGFDGGAENPEETIKRTGEKIEEWGGIDLAVLGIGKNGHLGLNEPGDSVIPYAHAAELDEKTRTHEMLKGSNFSIPRRGITLGIGDILNAKKILLLAAGAGKEAAWDYFLRGAVSPQFPVSFLHLHQRLCCITEYRIPDSTGRRP